ncbi:penicillin-binding transpeptidase domain-containing protein [Pseudomonadota bacterium]
MRRYLPLFCIALSCYLLVLPVELGAVRFSPSDISGVDRSLVSEYLTPYVQHGEFPEVLSLDTGSVVHEARLTYTLDPGLNEFLDGIYARYKPDYGAFVALDASTGAVIAMKSYIKDDEHWGNLTLLNSYPAASVFKVVTAAASLDQDLLTPASVLRYNGKKTSLYKSQVLKHKDNKWTRRPTLTAAFAQSINPVFARIGVYMLGADKLDNYAHRFGFNTEVETDINFETGLTDISDDQWRIAESASGYTRTNTLSPLHGAMLAGAIANEGRIMVPFVVKLATDEWGVPLYLDQPAVLSEPISPQTAAELRQLMRETVLRGSARKSFTKFFRGDFEDLDVGGKTGSLTGRMPAGKYDWFVGYAIQGDKRVSFASLTINKEYWTVKAHYVARKFIEAAFSKDG